MKIGFVLDTVLDSDAGVQQFFKGLARYMLKQGHDIRFICPKSKKDGEFKGKVISLGNSTRVPFSTTSIPLSFGATPQGIGQVLKREQFDILHVSAPFSPFMGGRVVKAATCPIVSTYMIRSKDFIYRGINRIIFNRLQQEYNKVNIFLALSPVAKKEAEKLINKKHIVMSSGADLSCYTPHNKPLPNFTDDYKNILFLGRLEERKGVRYLLRAFKIVCDRFPGKYRLIIAGDGPSRGFLERLSAFLGLTNVVFTGYVSEVDKPRYYASADLCVFPAILGESFGIVLLEAMASGKPVLAFDNAGYRSVLGDIPDALVHNRDIAQLAWKIGELLNNQTRLDTLAKNCLETSKQYDWNIIGAKHEAVYKSLVVA